MFKFAIFAILIIAVQSQDTWRPGTRDPRCPPEEKGDSPTFFPGPDCQTFGFCANGILFPFYCPDHLDFNSRLEVCDFAASAGCVATGRWTIYDH